MDTIRFFLWFLTVTVFDILFFSTSGSARFVFQCPMISLRRGKVRIRNGGRIARFTCLGDYQLLGEKAILCIQGQWDDPPPVCIKSGCLPRASSVENALVFESYRGALAKFTCYPGYSISGPSVLTCDGRYWNGSLPSCWKNYDQPVVKPCDFETDFCGWTNKQNDQFDWVRHSMTTPSGMVGTGPAYDHTLGYGRQGHYIYLETSSPRSDNDTAVLVSPYLPPVEKNKTTCFIFWYHMFGATVGTLNVYVRSELAFSENGNHGNRWIRGIIPITEESIYQIRIEGVRGTGYMGDIAVDDLKLAEDSACSPNSTEEETSPPLGTCVGRCHDNTTSDENSCYCHESCHINSSCCEDFLEICGIEAGPASGGVTKPMLPYNSTTSRLNSTTANKYSQPVAITLPTIPPTIIKEISKVITSIPVPTITTRKPEVKIILDYYNSTTTVKSITDNNLTYNNVLSQSTIKSADSDFHFNYTQNNISTLITRNFSTSITPTHVTSFSISVPNNSTTQYFNILKNQTVITTTLSTIPTMKILPTLSINKIIQYATPEPDIVYRAPLSKAPVPPVKLNSPSTIKSPSLVFWYSTSTGIPSNAATLPSSTVSSIKNNSNYINETVLSKTVTKISNVTRSTISLPVIKVNPSGSKSFNEIDKPINRTQFNMKSVIFVNKTYNRPPLGNRWSYLLNSTYPKTTTVSLFKFLSPFTTVTTPKPTSLSTPSSVVRRSYPINLYPSKFLYRTTQSSVIKTKVDLNVKKTTLSNSANWKLKYLNNMKGNHAPQTRETENTIHLSSIAGIILLLAACTIFAITVGTFLRKRKIRRERGSDEDSDVQFLTSDEFINFNLARPSPERQVQTNVSESQG